MSTTHPVILGVDVTEVHATARHALGLEVTLEDAGVTTTYRYVQATGTRAQYDLSVISNTHQLGAGIDTTVDNGPVRLGVPQISGFSTSTPFGWVATRGNLTVNALANCLASVELYTTATAGKVDDDATGTALIPGFTLTSAVGVSPAAAPAFAAVDLYCAGS